MANIKFSQFTAETDIANFDDIVGYAGAVNTRITPANLASSLITLSGGPYLPLTAGSGVPLTGDLNLAATGAGPSVGSQAVVFNGVDDVSAAVVAAKIFTLDSTANPAGQDLIFQNADDAGALKTNLYISAFGQVGVGNFTPVSPPNFSLDVSGDANFGGAVGFSDIATFNDAIIDQSGTAGNGGYVLKSTGAGALWKRQQPGCQLKISGTTGLGNTTDGIDFEVQYNATIVNDDSTIFTPQLIGGGGPNIGIQVLQDGRYEFFARYSTFDILQPGLPNVDGTKFLRIVAAVNGIKQCILQDLIVPTALNGEANVTGGGFMDLVAGDIFGIIGFHTGATGGAGNQGFPVSNNALFNEPMLWLVKID